MNGSETAGSSPTKTPLDAYWSAPLDDLFSALGSSRQGLPSALASDRLRELGPNDLSAAHRPPSDLTLFLRQFRDPLTWILIFAAVVSIIVRAVTDAFIIMTIIIATAVLTFFQERRASAAIQALLSRIALKTRLLRDGKEQSTPSAEIVPGDVILLSAGALVPADAVVISAKDLHVSQGALTGESFPVEKEPGIARVDAALSERSNCVFSGTSVRSGVAQALVVRTGKSTHFGQISESLVQGAPETDFERGLRQFGYLLTRAMIGFVLVILTANLYLDKPFMDSLLFSLAIAVGISPELLPAILGLSLAKGARRMAASGVIVRKLDAIESLGGMEILCSDKTGTLTTGEVRLVGVVSVEGKPTEELELLAYLNAALETGIINPLDEAIRAQLESKCGKLESYEKLDEIPYDFQRRRLTIVVRERNRPGARPLLIMKGATANVLELCQAPSEAELNRIQSRIGDWAKQGLRVLALATRSAPEQAAFRKEDERDFELRGFLLFEDPPHPDAAEAIRELCALGVTLKIITGDNRFVAETVAKKVGLSSEPHLTGSEIADTPDDVLWRRAVETSIFSEVDPNQKERIILALKKHGHSVGYLGDGINDAPALLAADVGISVESAVDVARETADLVMVNHELKVIARGIEAGRITFANTLKYIYTTTSANFGNMITLSIASLFLPFLPLLASQVLLNNFLSDVPAFALENDQVDAQLIRRAVRWDIRMVRDFMIRFGLVSSLFDGVTFYFLLKVYRTTPELFRTSWFLESLMTEVLIIFVVRTRGRFYKSRPSRALLLSSVMTILMSVLVPYLPLREWFGFVPIPAHVLAAILIITAAYAWLSEWVKFRLWPQS